MSKLIAEKRLDKNGKLVTRHVSAVPSTPSSASTIPAPSSAPSTKRLVTKTDYATEIADFLLEAAGDEDRESAAKDMSEFLGIRVLRLVHERMHDTDEWDGELLEMGLSRIMRMKMSDGTTMSPELRDKRAAALVESLPIIKEFCAINISPYSAANIASIVAYAAKVNHLKLNSPTMNDEDRAVLRYCAFEAILNKASFAHERDWLFNEAKWFDENREELSEHAKMIRDRGITDRELLEAFINKEGHRVLVEGTL